MSRRDARSADLTARRAPRPVALSGPALFDTAVWTWVRDRRFPELAEWFNEHAREGNVLVCAMVVLELVRLSPNGVRAAEVADRLAAFPSVEMPGELWMRARETQMRLAAAGDHRRVPPADLLIAAAAEAAGVTVVHHDGDYERISAVTELEQSWFVPRGSLA